MTNAEFINHVNRIAQSNPTYREGGDGSDGTCDCIGLVMGAMYAGGQQAYDMHSSNYFARFQTDDLQTLGSEDQLSAGNLVYKARNGAEHLHSRYLPGGRYDTGDLLDYYHVGVVAATEPLRIVHCTSSGTVNGIKWEETAEGWTHFGSVKGVDDVLAAETYTAVVTAPSGSTVNLRVRPDQQSPIAARVPVGSSVEVHEKAQGWARVTAGKKRGYMMTAFLLEKPKQTNAVSIPREAILQLISTLEAWL